MDVSKNSWWTRIQVLDIAGENFVRIPVYVDFAMETALNSSIRLQQKLRSRIQVI